MRYSERERNRDRDRERRNNNNRNRNDKKNKSGQEYAERRNRSHRRRRREFSRRLPKQRKDYPLCPLCEKAIQELTSAITHTESGKPAHFDCIMKRIESTEGLAANERICYLGKGSFGILRFQKNGGSIPFIIRKRIQYETIEETPEWRRKLDQFTHIESRERQRYKEAMEKHHSPPHMGKKRL